MSPCVHRDRPVRTKRIALLVGALAAIFVLPVAAPWITWITTTGNVPGPFLIIAGLLVTALALLAAKLLRWE